MEKQKIRLLFGLGPKSLIVNGLIMLTLSAFLWSLVLCFQAQWKLEEIKYHAKQISSIYDIPLFLFGWIMLSRAFDYYFFVDGVLNIKVLFIKYCIVLPLVMFYSIMLKSLFVIMLLEKF